MRNMSFSLTTLAFVDGSKDVTRRMGWKTLKPGERFMAVRKSMGLKKGEKVECLGECECVSNATVTLDTITADDVRREGFKMPPADFVKMFCLHMRCDPRDDVQRIEFKRIGGAS